MKQIDLSTLRPVGVDFGRIMHHGTETVIAAGAGTDAFVPPDGSAGIDRLPGLRLPVPAGPWVVSTRTAPAFAAAFDAGALMLRTEGVAWGKLAYEQSPNGRRMAVSVVTRDTSDDANGPLFGGPFLYLRACFTGTAHAFHVSADGRQWDLVRFFTLPQPVVAVELIAQSPTGEGCAATFSELRLGDDPPRDLRDGT